MQADLDNRIIAGKPQPQGGTAMRSIMLFLGIAAVLLAAALVANAKPDTKPVAPVPKAKADAPIPFIAGKCHFGAIGQDGRKIQIDGHDSWYVEVGEIAADGKSITVQWLNRYDPKTAVGVYHLHQDGSITGTWGWSENAKLENGVWTGLVNQERLREPVEPDF